MKRYLIALILLFATTVQAEVIVNSTRDIDGTKQWVMVTLTVDGDTVRYTTVQPWNTSQPVLSGAELEAYANSREDWLKLNILKQMYPNARPTENTLEAFQAWVTAGHTNAPYCKGNTAETEVACSEAGGTWIPEEVISKVPWVNSWQLSKVQAENDMKQSILYNKTNQQIADYIQANVTDLAAARLYLYKLTKEVRDIVKRQGWE